MHAYPEDVKQELTKAVKNMEQVLGYDSEPATDENQGQHISDFDPQKEEKVRGMPCDLRTTYKAGRRGEQISNFESLKCKYVHSTHTFSVSQKFKS